MKNIEEIEQGSKIKTIGRNTSLPIVF